MGLQLAVACLTHRRNEAEPEAPLLRHNLDRRNNARLRHCRAMVCHPNVERPRKGRFFGIAV